MHACRGWHYVAINVLLKLLELRDGLSPRMHFTGRQRNQRLQEMASRSPSQKHTLGPLEHAAQRTHRHAELNPNSCARRRVAKKIHISKLLEHLKEAMPLRTVIKGRQQHIRRTVISQSSLSQLPRPSPTPSSDFLPLPNHNSLNPWTPEGPSLPPLSSQKHT